MATIPRDRLKGQPMTKKADYNAEEWSTLVEAPLLAGMRLVKASRGGTIRESMALGKAYTAARMRVSTTDFTKRISTPGAFNPAQFDAQLATGAGGVPIKAGEETIGGIAVAGAPGGDKDEACAQAGVTKISDRLK